MSEAIRVLIVDDSRIFRAAIESALQGQEGVVVAGSVFRGEAALDFIRAHPPDIVTLDVEMPGMNGLQTLQAIEQINRTLPRGTEVGVIMVSAFTKKGAAVTIQALQAGAFDFVTKPAVGTPEENLGILRQDLLAKIQIFLSRRRHRAGTHTSISADPPVLPPGANDRQTPQSLPRTVRAILIGASTGGPKALATLLPDLVKRVDAPVLVAQHMPAEFTQSLAEHLARQIGTPVVEAADGLLLNSGTVYIARGGYHFVLRRDPLGRLVAGLNEQPPESGCRPSASVLFRSAAAYFGGDAVAIVLTGMGTDGTAGLGPLKRAGAYVIAQDEESSVVWGMPGSAVAAGLVDSILPLQSIAAAVGAISTRRSKD